LQRKGKKCTDKRNAGLNQNGNGITKGGRGKKVTKYVWERGRKATLWTKERGGGRIVGEKGKSNPVDDQNMAEEEGYGGGKNPGGS